MKYSKQLSTNSRIIKDLLTKYKDTFAAFCELLNNSIQAKATRIELVIDYGVGAAARAPFKRIELVDNGVGVNATDFEKKILEIGTDVKKDGKGIGRFGALQLGEKMTITTVAEDVVRGCFTLVVFPLDTGGISSSLSKVNLEFDVEDLKKRANPYYRVVIENLHHNKQGRLLPKNKIADSFRQEAIEQALFEKYPLQVFNRELRFVVNGKELDPAGFVVERPHIRTVAYTDVQGNGHSFDFHFYQLRVDLAKVKVFFYVDNAGIKTVAHEFTYSSDWYTPDLGTWFVYLDSAFFNTDLFRNIDLDSLGDEEIRRLKEFIKDTINDFFKAQNKRFEKFIADLEKDPAYPASFESPISASRELLFQKIAYLVEDDYKLLDKDERIRGLFYSLIDKSLASGHVEEVFGKVVRLSDANMQKFHQLLEKTELENVISFASAVAAKLEFLDLLHELIYGEVAEVLRERSQLHKIIERELWLFGEAYNGTQHLWSDKKIGNILRELREKYLAYQPSEADENLIEVEGLDNITDLFFLNEKVLDNEDREVMVVELKSPRCAIGRKELQQIDEYAFTVESYPGLPKENIHYKFVLISSKLTAYTKSKMRSSREKYHQPFLYDRKPGKNIEVFVMEWSELIELNKRKLGYLSAKLKVKDKSVREKFEAEYPGIINEKVSARLTRTKGGR
ncbi:MAG TPA: ATP-binding protein [Puia sp.]|nr:ATP-binding protein [Puia sp.]